MDTRTKILTLDAALELPRGLAIAAGAFDVPCAEHVREHAPRSSCLPHQYSIHHQIARQLWTPDARS